MDVLEEELVDVFGSHNQAERTVRTMETEKEEKEKKGKMSLGDALKMGASLSKK